MKVGVVECSQIMVLPCTGEQRDLWKRTACPGASKPRLSRRHYTEMQHSIQQTCLVGKQGLVWRVTMLQPGINMAQTEKDRVEVAREVPESCPCHPRLMARQTTERQK